MSLETVMVAIGDDDEERVASIAQTAIDIAAPAGATVHLVHVFSDEQYGRVKRQLEFGPDDEVTPDAVAKRHATIRNVGTLLEEAGVDHAWHGAVGDTSDELLALTSEFAADMLIVGGRGRSPAGKAVFGSTAQEILLNADCPVTDIREP